MVMTMIDIYVDDLDGNGGMVLLKKMKRMLMMMMRLTSMMLTKRYKRE